jgi:hypothetical protein
MRRIIPVLGAILLLYALAGAQDTLTIRQIQTVPENGDISPYRGDTVVTGGVVTAGFDVFRYDAGYFYLADPAGGPFSGIYVHVPGAYIYRNLAIGDSIIFSARVLDYGTTTLEILRNTLQFRGTMPLPEPLTVSGSFLNPEGQPNSEFEPYESCLLKVEDVTFDNSPFLMGYILNFHDATDSFTAVIQSNLIRHIVTLRSNSGFNGIQGFYPRDVDESTLGLRPRSYRDFIPNPGFPVVSRIACNPRLPMNMIDVTLSAFVWDSGSITDARFNYRVDGGAWNNIIAQDSGYAGFSCLIPGYGDGTQVQYYFSATDGDGHTVTEPPTALDSVYLYTVGYYELCSYIPGDINGSGETNGVDIVFAVRLFSNFDGPPPYACDCPANNYPFFPAGDVNGNCSFNGIDVTYMVAYFKGGANLSYCPTCPPAD